MHGRVRKSKDILEQLHGQYADRLCDPIRYNVKLSQAAGRGKTIFEYARHSPGAEDYQCLVDKIARER